MKTVRLLSISIFCTLVLFQILFGLIAAAPVLAAMDHDRIHRSGNVQDARSSEKLDGVPPYFGHELKLYDHQDAAPVSSETSRWIAQQALETAAASETIAEEKGTMTVEEIAELMANPFSYLWFGMVQNDTYWYDGDLLDEIGEDTKVLNTTLIQPVLSFQFTPESRLIFRPVIPINSFPTVSNFDFIEDEPEGPIIDTDWDRKTGLGDIVLWTAYSPQYTPPLVYGFGPTIMMDTASRDELGTGKWSAGPMATVAHITDKWIFGCVAQHWWSFAGDSDRDSVNLTDIQPIIRYRLSPQTNIGVAPNIRHNWNADSGEKWQVPLGLGISTVVMLGPLPLGIGVEGYYYVESPDTLGPEYQLRFFVTPVLPAPEWSRIPLFGR